MARLRYATVLLVLFALLPPPPQAGAEVARFGTYADEATDPDGNGVLDNLTFTVDVTANASGEYTLRGRLLAGGVLADENTTTLYIEEGATRKMKLVFSGDRIFESQGTRFFGAFTVQLTLYREGYAEPLQQSLNTRNYYRSEKFGPKASDQKRIPSPNSTLLPSFYKAENSIISIEVPEAGPPFYLYYSRDNRSVMRFQTAFRRIIGFADTGNGYYDEGEAVVTVEMLSGKWSVRQAAGKDKFRGEFVEYVLERDVDFTAAATGSTAGTAHVTLRLALAAQSYTYTIPGGRDRTVTPGTEFALSAEVSSPSGMEGVTAFAFETGVSDAGRGHDFLVLDAPPAELSGSPRTTTAVRQFRNATASFQQALLVNSTGVPHYIHTWSAGGTGVRDGSVVSLTVNTSYAAANGTLLLYHSVPYNRNQSTSAIHVFPALVEANGPPWPPPPAPPRTVVKHDARVYAVGSALALLFISVSLYLRARAFRKRMLAEIKAPLKEAGKEEGGGEPEEGGTAAGGEQEEGAGPDDNREAKRGR